MESVTRCEIYAHHISDIAPYILKQSFIALLKLLNKQEFQNLEKNALSLYFTLASCNRKTENS